MRMDGYDWAGTKAAHYPVSWFAQCHMTRISCGPAGCTGEWESKKTGTPMTDPPYHGHGNIYLPFPPSLALVGHLGLHKKMIYQWSSREQDRSAASKPRLDKAVCPTMALRAPAPAQHALDNTNVCRTPKDGWGLGVG